MMMIIKTVVASNNNLFVASPRKVPAALQRLFVALSHLQIQTEVAIYLTIFYFINTCHGVISKSAETTTNC